MGRVFDGVFFADMAHARLVAVLAFIRLFENSLCTCFADTDFQAHGSAIVPGVQIATFPGSSDRLRTYLFITNITDSPVTCRLTFYDHEGNTVTNDSSFLQVLNGNTNSSQAVIVASGSESVTFEIPAHGTRQPRINFTAETNKYLLGHAVLEWTATDTRLRKALITRVRHTYNTSTAMMGESVLVNGGQPF